MHRTTLFTGPLCLMLLTASIAHAQSARDRARMAIEQAQAHGEEGRHALAAQRYLDAYEHMSEAGIANAPLVLWNAGDQLSMIPGREREAIDTLRRFLEESSALADEAAQVRDWRSNALSLLDELEARASPDERVESQDTSDEPPSAESRISPIGPVVLGVGGVTLAVGVIVGAFSLGQASEFRDACSDLTMCPTRLRPQYDEMRAYSAAADVLMVAGGIIAVAGLILTLALGEDVEVAASAACTSQGCLAFARGSF